MTTSLALASLEDWLGEELSSGSEDDTALLAGHYAIFTGGAAAVDLLDSPDPVGGPAEMLDFTAFTWEVACRALSEQRRAQLIVLVDDIQFVIPSLDDRGRQEQLAAALAEQYLRATPTLPAFHSRLLTTYRLDDTDVLKRGADRWVFSERELRISHVRRLKGMVRDQKTPAGMSVNADMSRVTVTSEEHGEYCLVHSGRTTCAGGYVELLCSAYERGIRRVITLVPMRCLGPITVGTALGSSLMGLSGLTVINVAIPDVASGVAAVVTRTPA